MELSSTDFRITMLSMFSELKRERENVGQELSQKLGSFIFKRIKWNEKFNNWNYLKREFVD